MGISHGNIDVKGYIGQRRQRRRINVSEGDWSMTEQVATALASLYEQDETAWLEQLLTPGVSA
jgi:hypothetical protein